MRDSGTENDRDGQSCLLVDIQRNIVGTSGGVGITEAASSASSSPSSLASEYQNSSKVKADPVTLVLRIGATETSMWSSSAANG